MLEHQAAIVEGLRKIGLERDGAVKARQGLVELPGLEKLLAAMIAGLCVFRRFLPARQHLLKNVHHPARMAGSPGGD